MSFRVPPPPSQISYTTGEPPSVAVQPGGFRVRGPKTITAQRVQFASGKGPGAGGTFTARWLRNGVSLGTITVAASTDSASIGPPANPILADGDILTFEVTGNAGAAPGAAVGILDVQ